MPSDEMSSVAPLISTAMIVTVPVGKFVKKAGVVSTTVMWKLPVVVSPPASVTWHVTVVAPSAGLSGVGQEHSPCNARLDHRFVERSVEGDQATIAHDVRLYERAPWLPQR